MTDSHRREEEIFSAALGYPPTQRAAFVRESCGGDTALRQRIEALLAAHAGAGAFLETSVPEIMADLPPGTRLGRYVITRKLGEGGVGHVFEAEQTEPLRRRVALKVIKLGMDTREVIARFETERQALALMDHPGIAKVFDAGATAAGRPYFVMELVEGVPLTQFCDEANLPPAARLELFIKVCQAVQHAHQKGVIHRDLKPTNILVARQDGTPAPKIIDFGIAKATEARLTDHTFSTAVAQFVGTPAYMSPEQTVLGGTKDIDTRSDVYALGVLLYELLTGHTPFGSRASLQGGLDELRRRIREEEPARPSTLLTTIGGDKLALAARARGLEPARLVGLLRGELDWIILRCLEKDPGRRYPTANGLAEDLRRHLQHEPVNAVAPSALYIFGKFARRYRAAFVSGAAVAGILVGATAVSAWQAVRAARAERLASERAAAETAARAAADAARLAAESAERAAAKEAQTAKAISAFLQNDLLAQAAPGSGVDRDVQLRVVLDRAAAQLAGRFADQPLVKADLHETVASTYEGLGLYAEMEKHYTSARALREKSLGAAHRDTLRVASWLASAAQLQGRFKDAETLARETAAAQAANLGADDLDTLVTRSRLASAVSALGRNDEAMKIQEELLAAYRNRLGADHPETLQLEHNLGGTYSLLGRYADAEKTLADTLDRRRRVHGPDHPRTLTTTADLAVVLNNLGRHAEALTMQQANLAARERVLGPEHPETLNTLNSVAAALYRLGRLPEAADTFARVREGKARVLGSEHPETLAAAGSLASTWAALGRFAEAEPLNREVISVRRRLFGPEHPETLRALSSQGNILAAMGRPAEAEAVQREILEARRRVLGPDHPDTLRSAFSLGQALRQQEKWADGIAVFTPALAARRAKLGAAHPETLQTADELGLCLLGAGRFAESEVLFRELIVQREKSAAGSWQLAASRSDLGAALMEQGKLAEAEPLHLAAEEALRAAAPKLPSTARRVPGLVRQRLVRLYTLMDKPAEADKWR